MAYIGREPSFGAFERQTITPDGSTTTFTLNFTVGSSSSILVNVAGVVQDPTGAYGISEGGTKIVFTAAPASGDTVFIIFLGIALDSSGLLSTSSITSQTDLGAAPATGDSLLLHDTSASALKEMTVANLFTSPTLTSPTVATSLDMNGTELILDANGNTSITADTDDQIDFKVGGSDIFSLTSSTKVKEAGKETIWIPSAAITPTQSNGCASRTQVETTAGRPDMDVLDFDASSDEHAQFSVAFPKSWNAGTITFQVYWTTTATDTDGVSWGLQGVAVSDNDTIDVAYGTAVVVDDAALSAAEDLCVTAESGAVTIAGTPADNDIVYFRIFRDVSDSNDTAAEDARLIGVKIFFTTDLANDA